jgi:hypothetical protein
MGWIVGLVSLAVLVGINKWIKGKGGKRAKKVIALATMAIAFACGCGFASTVLGQWGAGALGWATGLLAGWFGEQGVATALHIGLAVLLVLCAAADIAYDRKADKGAQMAAVVLPTLLLLVVGGAMGQHGGEAVRLVNTEMASLISTLGGS